MVAERKVNNNIRDDFDRLSAQQGGFVAPPQDGFAGGKDKKRVAAYKLQILNGAGFADDRGENNLTLYVRCSGNGRI